MVPLTLSSFGRPYFRDACDDRKNVCVRRLFVEVPLTSFHEGKAKKAKPAKNVFVAHKPFNW